MTAEKSCQVRVGVRVRPLASKELQQGGKVSLNINPPASISIAAHKSFTYDAVFDTKTSQDELYGSVSSSLLDSFVEGYNATILAYGQTGSGKTYTMGSEAHTQPEGSPQVGLIPRFISDFFEKMQERKQASDETAKAEENHTDDSPLSNVPTPPVLLDYHMKASFLEVYGEDVYDLLDSERKSLPLREDSTGGVVVSGLTDISISDSKEALNVLHEGTNNRTTAATLMNLTSSRSHAVFTIHLTQRTRGQDQVDVVSTSKFTFVDLAGSERMKKTGAEGERAREGIKINEGLLALGNVINALADEERLAKEKSVYVPYRQSKLTRLLQDALGGNSQTFFLACVSPSDTNISETLSTLRYANRARNIRNAPTKNLDATTSELQRLNALNRVLQSELVKARFQNGDEGNDEETIGVVDESLFKRSDVEEYLERIHRTASKISGVDKIPALSFQPIASTSLQIPVVSAKYNGSLPTIEATPFKATTSDRIDESFHIDVNPDEDIAILDRLLELQHHDHEFDKAKKRDDEKLKKMDGELQKEEALLLQLRESLKAYHSLKQKYEELMAEVQQLEVEKDTLAKQLEKATVDPTTGNSAAIKRQLEKVELNLTRARRETLTHRQKYKAAEDQARRCQVLERKITTLKQAKTTLLKKQKETAARYKEVTEAKTKELLALKRKEKAANTRLSKMKTEIQQHKTNLEKRKQYCTKLSDKLKQTESHLMKLLSMRQRDLVEKASIVEKKGIHVADTGNDESDSTSRHSRTSKKDVLSSEDLKIIRFISDKMISEKIDREVSSARYKEHVAEYSATMRLVVDHVKMLQERESHMDLDDSESSSQSIDELREAIAELELKLELLGADVKEMESLLPDEGKQSRDEEAVKKLLGKLPSVGLRKLLFDSFKQVVELETDKLSKEELLSRKDAALSSLENELDIMHGKLDSLARDLARRRLLDEQGKDVFTMLDEAQREITRLGQELKCAQETSLSSSKLVAEMKIEVEAQKNELQNTKDSLVLAEISLQNLNGSVEAEDTLVELHKIWTALNVDVTVRSRARDEIQNCISYTCDRHLKEATTLKLSTETEICELEAKKAAIQSALSLRMNKNGSQPGLLQEVERLRAEVGALQPIYDAANVRREKIISDMISLSSALGIHRDDLPESLQELMQQIEKVQPSTKSLARLRRVSMMENVQAMVNSIGKELTDEVEETDPAVTFNYLSRSHLPQGSLEEEFLRRCEADIEGLRVKKSEMLVKNRESIQGIHEIASNLHSSVQDLVDLVERSMKEDGHSILPVWWDSNDAADLLRRSISATSPRFDAEKDDSRCIHAIYEALKIAAATRQKLSSLLQQIVEKAQQTLLDIVGREVDASEAYASFHDALLKLPSLSTDFSHTCISEMEALVVGVEAMTQSEIEALTVVWEALKVSSEERRAFWGRIDDTDSTSKGDSRRFDDLKLSLPPNAEDWIVQLVLRGKEIDHELDIKLFKLAAIHSEVEKLRSKQDTKSQVLSLDSEIRILNSKLQDFEELQCSKQRLLTKKSGSTALLKEARFRKQMKSKFVAKLEQLASLLKSWEHEEGCSFDASLLSDDVRMLLNNPDKMESWIEKRTRLMPSRTVPTKSTPRKRSFEEGQTKTDTKSCSSRQAGDVAQPRKRIATSAQQVRSQIATQPSAGKKHARSPVRAKKPPLGGSENAPSQQEKDSDAKAPSIKRVPKIRRKDSTTLPPFGRILSELSSPDRKSSK